jgi:hypothetical protein
MAFPSTSTEFAMIDTRTTSGAFVLPLTREIPGRIINIKDAYGAFTNSSLTVYTQGGEAFEDGTNFRILNNAWDQLQVYTASTSRWYITGGTEQNITTTNISVVSTLQTFNWPSLCNAANFGYGSTFNPTAIGRIALLDNVFTSSTAGLVSTFIEMGNLNAQPTIMSTGGAFRWLMGVEPDIGSMGRGLQFKIKRWNSFGFSNSPIFYGANLSTLIDSFNIDSRGFVGINNSTPTYLLDVNSTPLNADALSVTGNHVMFQNTTIGRQQIGRITGTYTAGGGLQAGVLNIQGPSTIQFGPLYSGTSNMVVRTGPPGAADFGFVGINNGAPSYTLHVGGGVGISNVNTAYGHLKLFPNSNGGEAAIAFYSTVTEANTFMWMVGRAQGFGTVGNFAISPISNLNVTAAVTTTFTPTGNVGIRTLTPAITHALEVNGLTRSKITISNITATSLSPAAADYSTYYSLSNTGFNTVTLPALSGNSSNNGWFVVLRNATTVAMSITFTTNACNNIPSPLSLPSSNSITIGYDFTNTVFRAF